MPDTPLAAGARRRSADAWKEALEMEHPERIDPGQAAADTAASDARPRMVMREGVLVIPGEVALYHGGMLQGTSVAWRLEGAEGAPIVAALGGISAHRRVYGDNGWWNGVVGPGCALDAAQLRLLSFDYLGGSGESSGPRPGEAFPRISTYDQADALLRLLNHLGVTALHGIVGASYGGMVALAFAERYPERVGRLIVVSAADRAHPMATAWRSVQRRVMRFAARCGQAGEGVEIARALAMATYRSPEEFAARFSGAPRTDTEVAVFPVEEYLFARGAEYAARHSTESFLCLSESIDLHRVDTSRIFVPTTAVAVREDQLVPVSDMRRLVARLEHARLHEISSVYGHDAFLKEAALLRPAFADLTGSPA
ncbi:MAG TPA: homoserine O-succinyltransferase [Steroidobacteraceae bacterium]|nr:homoserine O-succinyltransferase [Steroidobacteraceae bacterium]